jgi:hypothetical protein
LVLVVRVASRCAVKEYSSRFECPSSLVCGEVVEKTVGDSRTLASTSSY